MWTIRRCQGIFGVRRPQISPRDPQIILTLKSQELLLVAELHAATDIPSFPWYCLLVSVGQSLIVLNQKRVLAEEF